MKFSKYCNLEILFFFNTYACVVLLKCSVQFVLQVLKIQKRKWDSSFIVIQRKQLLSSQNYFSSVFLCLQSTFDLKLMETGEIAQQISQIFLNDFYLCYCIGGFTKSSQGRISSDREGSSPKYSHKMKTTKYMDWVLDLIFN